MEKYYRYKGSLEKCEIKDILIKIISISRIYNNYRLILNDEFSKILGV